MGSLSFAASMPPIAWQALISAHDRSVVLSLLARGVRLDRAREIAHDAWARLYEQATLGRLTRLELPGLAIAQAAFIAAQEGRRAQRLLRALPPGPTQEMPDVADSARSAEDRVSVRQDLALAHQVLSSCPARAQEVFALAYECPDRPQLDIAREVGLSVQRVRQILWEVRGRIRAALEASRDE